MHKQAEAVEQVGVELEAAPVVGELVAQVEVQPEEVVPTVQEAMAILEALQVLDLDLAILHRALSPA